MARLSIGKAWEETVAFVKREGQLLFPVAFLFLALPLVVLQQMMPPELMAELERAQPGPGGQAVPQFPASLWLGVVLTMIITLIGALTLYALSLRPGISVGEAMRLGVRRLPVLIASGLLLALGVFAIALLLAVLLVLLGFMVGTAALSALTSGLMFGAILFVGVRMLLLQAVAIDRPVGPVQIVRQSWALTRGQFWRLLGFLIVLILLVSVVQLAVQSIFGVIGGLLGGADLARFAGSIALAAISAVIQVYFMVMTARIYRQLSDA